MVDNIITLESLDYKKISAYLITLDRNSPDVDYRRLKSAGVIAVMIEAGYLYNSMHIEQEYFRNPKLRKQVEDAYRNKVQYALYTTICARNSAELMKELYQIKLCIESFTPPLGIWLKLGFNNNKKTNNTLLDICKAYLIKLGLKNKIGLYVTKSELNKIDWNEERYNDWLLWLNKHIDDLSSIEQVLKPEFFMT